MVSRKVNGKKSMCPHSAVRAHTNYRLSPNDCFFCLLCLNHTAQTHVSFPCNWCDVLKWRAVDLWYEEFCCLCKQTELLKLADKWCINLNWKLRSSLFNRHPFYVLDLLVLFFSISFEGYRFACIQRDGRRVLDHFGAIIQMNFLLLFLCAFRRSRGFLVLLLEQFRLKFRCFDGNSPVSKRSKQFQWEISQMRNWTAFMIYSSLF